MTSPATIHDDWFKLGLAITAFAVSMLFASLLMPADDVPTATVASDVLGP